MYAVIAYEDSKDPTYASVGVATDTPNNITTNTSYDTVMLQNMNPNVCYGNVHDVWQLSNEYVAKYKFTKFKTIVAH